MCEWRHFVEICKKAPKSDILILLITFILTVVFDLIVAIEVGMICATLLFLKRMADVSSVRKWAKDNGSVFSKEIPKNTEIFDLNGAMFFASTDLLSHFDISEETKVVIFRMSNTLTLDISAVRILSSLFVNLKNRGVTVILSHINSQPMKVIKKFGVTEIIGEENISANIDTAIEKAKAVLSAVE